MSFPAETVKVLRERTDAPIMDCKRALQETAGNLEAAIEYLRKQGQAKAEKKASRIAADGVVKVLLSSDNRSGVIVEVNCETDFVARGETFQQFAEQVAKLALNKKSNKVAVLQDKILSESKTMDQTRKDLIAKLGENITIRRVQFLESQAQLIPYVHGAGRIAVLVNMSGSDNQVAKDVAMHIAAQAPLVVSSKDIPAENVEREKNIFSAQAQQSGKPAEIVEKMVQGRIQKYLQDVSLLEQPFIKDPSQTVGAYLQAHQTQVFSFARFAVGEGIEKEQTDFAQEVKAITDSTTKY